MAKQKETEKKSKALQSGELYRAPSPFEELDRLMGSFMRSPWSRLLSEEWSPWPQLGLQLDRPMPRVDVIDSDENVEVMAELPGVKKEELDISVSDNTLTIRGSTSHEETKEQGEYHRREIRRGEFSRTVVLPAPVNGDQAKASFENGVLKISLPKLAKAKRRNIQVE